MMFECTHDIHAYYAITPDDTRDSGETTLQVLAWDDAGIGYVLGDVSLVRASSLQGFLRIGLRTAGKPLPGARPPVVVPPTPMPNFRDAR